MSSKNILLITENLGSGGAERQLTGLAVLLKDRGYDVCVVTYVNRSFYLPYLKNNNVKHILLPHGRLKILRELELIRLIRRLHPGSVISFLQSSNLMCCLARLLFKFRLIVSERSHTYPSLRSKVTLRLYHLADYILTNSYSEEENLAHLYPPIASKLNTIVNFVDCSRFVPAREKKTGDERRVICVGRVIPSKNILRLIDAVKIVRNKGFNFRVDWYGAVYDLNFFESVKQKITETRMNDAFHIYPAISTIEQEYQLSDIFCLPSLYEGYPNVVVEAMSCALPIVCSNVCENPRIVEEGENGFLFNPLDVDDIASALIRALSMDEAQLNHIGKANREKVMKENSEEKFVASYMKLL